MPKVELDLLNETWKRTEREKHFARYNHAIRDARPFSLDNETVAMIAEMSSDDKRHKMIPLYREMARLPFPTVWIEFDFHFLHRWRMEHGTVFQAGTDIDEMMADLDSDRQLWGKPTRLGFLCDVLKSNDEAFRVTTFGMMTTPERVVVESESDRLPKPHVFPLVHNVSTRAGKCFFGMSKVTSEGKSYEAIFPGLRATVDRLNEESILPAMTWGMQPSTTKAEWRSSTLNGTNGVEPEPIMVEHTYSNESKIDPLAGIQSMLFSAAREQKGDLRFLVAAIALLNHVPVIYRPYRPRGHLLSHSQMKPYLSSNVVTIDLPNVRRRIKFADDLIKTAHNHSRHRRHEVRGHWRVSNKPRNGWEPFTDPQMEMRKRWRLWIAKHERGDATLGYVDHYYAVRAGQEHHHDKARAAR